MSELEYREEMERMARALGRTMSQLDDTKFRLAQSERDLAKAEEAVSQLREMLEKAYA